MKILCKVIITDIPETALLSNGKLNCIILAVKYDFITQQLIFFKYISLFYVQFYIELRIGLYFQFIKSFF